MNLTKLLSNISLITFIVTIINIEEEIRDNITIRPFTISLFLPLDNTLISNSNLLKEEEIAN